MTLVIVKNKTALDLPSLLRLVLKTIYETSKITSQDEDTIMCSMIDWKNHLDFQRESGFGIIDEENQISLEYIGKLLKDNMDGRLDKRKELFIRHGIDYKKFYRLPGSWKPEDFERAKLHHSQLPKEEQ